MKRIFFPLLFLTALTGLFFVFASVQAQTAGEKKPIQFTPQVTIPGSEIFQKGKTVTIDGDTLPLMIVDLYRVFVGMTGFVAVLVLMYAGYVWLFAAGNASRVARSKEYMQGAMFGLFLSLGSFVFLQFINPDLVNPAKFTLTPIPKVKGPVECPSDSDLVSIQNDEGLQIRALDPRVRTDTATALKLAGLAAFDRGFDLVVTSAHRDPEHQQLIYDCYTTKQKTGSCPASCSGINTNCSLACGGPNKADICGCPHVAGVAVDVCLNGSGSDATCSQMTTSANGTNTFQLDLHDIMESKGFKRICAEWWHFETPALSSRLCQAGFFGASGSTSDPLTDPR